MTNCDMIGVLSDGTTVTLGDYYSFNTDTPSTDDRLGGKNDLVYLSGGMVNGYINVNFSRLLNTGDPYDSAIVPDVKQHICWAYLKNNKGRWQEHSNYSNLYVDSALFNFATVSSSVYFNVNNADYKHQHGVALSVSWLFLASVGIIAARYFKHTHLWILIHIAFLLTASILTIYYSSYNYQNDGEVTASLESSYLKHSRLGSTLASIVISQVIFGFATSIFKIFTKNNYAIAIIRRAHKLTGYSMLILGFVSVISGWVIYADAKANEAISVIVIIIIIIIFVVLEIWHYRFSKNLNSAKFLNTLTHTKALDMMKNGHEYMFYDDIVADVADFKKAHPGGCYLIQENLGQDAGKYMIGCSSYGASMYPYTHSSHAFTSVRKLAIARITYPDGYITDGSYDIMEFEVLEKIPLNDHTFYLFLKSEAFRMATYCTDISWIGKHFKVILPKTFSPVCRYYSSLFVDLDVWKSELGLANGSRLGLEGVVKFIYKYYQTGTMTSYLNTLKVGDSLKIQGPLGPGLLLTELKGNYVGFAGGTGLVPFLDLVYYAWKANLSGAQDFKITLLVFFTSRKDGFALDILEETVAKSRTQWLDLHILVNKVEYQDKLYAIVQKAIEKSVEKAWVCGPSGFNKTYLDLLIKSGVDKNKIVVL